MPTFPTKTTSTDIKIQDLNCQEIKINVESESSELDDEILREILAEEEERKKT